MAKTQNKNIGLVKEIQKVLLDDSDFLRSLVQKNLQQVIETEFEEFLQAGPYERSQERNGCYTRGG
jgi:transposase-like protein